MKEGRQQQRGNSYFEYEFNVPFGLVYTKEIKWGENLLRPATKCGDAVLANRIGCLVCFDIDSYDLLWALETPGQSCQGVTYEDELYISASKEWLGRCDSDSGASVWKMDLGGEVEAIKLVSSNLLFTVARREDKKILHARSKEDGRVVWSYDKGGYGNYGNMMCDDGILIVKSKGGCQAFDELTGESIWSFGFEEWQEKNMPGEQVSQLVMLRLLVDDIFYLSFDNGFIAAVNAKTGGLVWLHSVKKPSFIPDGSPMFRPMTLVYRDGEILFTIDQGRGSLNYLTILDAKSGKQLYQSKENITPAGCSNPIVVGNKLIGGSDRHLAVFDIDNREFVWRYEHPENVDLFIGGVVPFDGGFVASSNQTNSLYWFKSSA